MESEWLNAPSVPVELVWFAPDDRHPGRLLSLIADREMRFCCSTLRPSSCALDLQFASTVTSSLCDDAERILWELDPSEPPVLDVLLTLDEERGRLIAAGDDVMRLRVLAGLGHRWVRVKSAPAWWDQRELPRTSQLLMDRSFEIYTPILVPALRSVRPQRDVLAPTRLDLVAALDLAGPIVDIGSNIGFFAQHFRRDGKSVIAYEPDPTHRALAESLQRLLRCGYDLHASAIEEGTRVRRTGGTGLLLTVLHHYLKDGDAVATSLLAGVDQFQLNCLIWESGPDPLREIQLITSSTALVVYQPLARFYATGHYREMGMFSQAQ